MKYSEYLRKRFERAAKQIFMSQFFHSKKNEPPKRFIDDRAERSYWINRLCEAMQWQAPSSGKCAYLSQNFKWYDDEGNLLYELPTIPMLYGAN